MTSIKANIKRYLLSSFAVLLLTNFTACSLADLADVVGIDVNNPSDSSTATESSAAAVASMFGNSGINASVSRITLSARQLDKMAEVALDESEYEYDCGEDDLNCTCTSVDEGDDGPDGVETSLYGDAGTYGADGYTMEVTADDFCTQPDGGGGQAQSH